jgi:GGDEF domain-containing protein
MISLRSYLFRDTDEDAESAYRRIIGLLLRGIALHAVEGDKADYDRFRADIDQADSALTAETPISDLLVVVGGALRAMEDYNHGTSKFVRRQNTELQNIVTMLTQTVITIGDSGHHSVGRLQDIEKAIERTQKVEDMQILKVRLGECLEVVREEVVRQKKDGQSALAILKQELESSRERAGSYHLPPALDQATGLPGKADAEKAIEAAVASPNGKFLLIAVCNRVQAINARFGYAVGDQVLAAFAEHLKQGLSTRDRIFRWTGPAVAAVIERTEKLDRIRTEIRRFADLKLEKTVEVGQRTVLLPISGIWSVFPVAPPLDALLKQIEAFTASQVPRDYV